MVSIALLMLLVVSATSFKALGYLGNNQSAFSIKTTGNVVDDFTTDLFRDASSDVFGWGSGTLTNERDFSVTVLDFYDTKYPVRGLDVQGRKAYVVQYNKSSSTDSVGCFSINDPTDIQLLSTRNSLSKLMSIAVDGDVIYAGRSHVNQIFNTYNVTDPFNLGGSSAYLDFVNGIGNVTDIEPDGHFVYYVQYGDSIGKSFRIVDAADPDNLIEYIPNWSSDKALGLDIVDHLAFIAASDDGFYILNKTDKYTPIELDHVNLQGNCTDVLVEDNIAYVTLGIEGIAVLDVSDPTNAIVIGTVSTGDSLTKMALQGNTLYATAGLGGVKVFDVADPTHITLVTGISMPFAWDIDLYGGVVVVGSEEGIHTFQIGEVDDFSTSYYENTFDDLEVWDVRVIGDIAYIAGGPDGFYTLNVRDPNNPILLDHIDTVDSFPLNKIDVGGQFAYLVGPWNCTSIDIRDPTNLKIIADGSGNSLGDVFVNGEIIYISWEQGGYACLNVTFPKNFLITPAYELDEPHFGSNITSLWVQDYKVYSANYIGGGGGGLFINDQRNLNSHQLISTYIHSAYNLDLKVDGDLAFLADTTWCVAINVTNPSNPTFIQDLRDNANALIKSNCIWNFGPYVITAGPDGVYLIETSDFTSPLVSTQYNYTAGALAVTSAGDFTYVANKSNLIILRHFKSAADTYFDTNNLAQSKSIFSMTNSSISAATLLVDLYNPCTDPTALSFEMTADGVNWETVTPNTLHNFDNTGSDLRWRAVFNGATDRSPHLYLVEISFEYKTSFPLSLLWIGIIAGGCLLLIIIIIVAVVAISKSKKKSSTR